MTQPLVSNWIHLKNLTLLRLKYITPVKLMKFFDAISYDKGASVIRMLQNYLGAERFQVWIGSP